MKTHSVAYFMQSLQNMYRSSREDVHSKRAGVKDSKENAQ